MKKSLSLLLAIVFVALAMYLFISATESKSEIEELKTYLISKTFLGASKYESSDIDNLHYYQDGKYVTGGWYFTKKKDQQLLTFNEDGTANLQIYHSKKVETHFSQREKQYYTDIEDSFSENLNTYECTFDVVKKKGEYFVVLYDSQGSGWWKYTISENWSGEYNLISTDICRYTLKISNKTELPGW